MNVFRVEVYWWMCSGWMCSGWRCTGGCVPGGGVPGGGVLVDVFQVEAYCWVCNRWFSPQGYQGMVDGGENIEEATWESVSSMLQVVRDEPPALDLNLLV